MSDQLKRIQDKIDVIEAQLAELSRERIERLKQYTEPYYREVQKKTATYKGMERFSHGH